MIAVRRKHDVRNKRINSLVYGIVKSGARFTRVGLRGERHDRGEVKLYNMQYRSAFFPRAYLLLSAFHSNHRFVSFRFIDETKSCGKLIITYREFRNN